MSQPLVRTIAAVSAGALLGSSLVALYFVARSADEADIRAETSAPTRTLVNVGTRSDEDVEAIRQQAFTQIETVEEAIALPGEFNRLEAFVALASRADSAGVQDLVYQANEIADSTTRYAALDIFLRRLVDLDPRTAVVVAGRPVLASPMNFERGTWAAWSRVDPDSAIDAALELPRRDRLAAANGIYIGAGSTSAEAFIHVLQTLEMEPDNNTLVQVLAYIVDRSPSEATRLVEMMPATASTRRGAVNILAHLALMTPGLETNIHFTKPSLAAAFRTTLEMNRLNADPEAAVRKYLDNPGVKPSYSAAFSLKKLAAVDFDKAVSYLPSFRPAERGLAIQMVAESLLATDPTAALAWIRDNDESSNKSTYTQIIGQVAGIDLDIALAELSMLPDERQRDLAIRSVVATIAADDIDAAQRLIAQISDPAERSDALSAAFRGLADTDPDAAAEWLQSAPADQRDDFARILVARIVREDPERAVRVLDRASEEVAAELRSTIVGSVVARRSLDEALAFINQFRGVDDYEALLAKAYSQLAKTEPGRALALASQSLQADGLSIVLSGVARDLVKREPLTAVTYAEQISDEELRNDALRNVAGHWLNVDPEAAIDWTLRQPTGQVKDSTLHRALMRRLDSHGATEVRRLLPQISEESRGRTAGEIINRMKGRSPDAAGAILDELNLTADTRQAVDEWLGQR